MDANELFEKLEAEAMSPYELSGDATFESEDIIEFAEPETVSIAAPFDIKHMSQTAFMSNDMIRDVIRQNSAMGGKLIYYMVSRLTKKDKSMPLMIFDVRELCVAAGLDEECRQNRARVRKLVLSLTESTAESFVLRANGWAMPLPWLRMAVFQENSNRVACQLNPDLAPYFLNLHSGFTSVNTIFTNTLKTQNSLLLYELCKGIQYLETNAITLAKFREIFKLNETTYTYQNILKRILNPSLEEINTKTDICVTVTPIKDGRKPVGLMFNVKDAINQRLTEERLDEWLEKLGKYRISKEELLEEYENIRGLLDCRGKAMPSTKRLQLPE